MWRITVIRTEFSLCRRLVKTITRKYFNMCGYLLKSFSRRENFVFSLWLMKHISILIVSLINRTSNIFTNTRKKYTRIVNEKELHTQRVTVWCAIMCDRIIGQYFFENAEGFTETVNGERYRHMLNTCLRPIVIYLRNRRKLWFQQDRATCHTANKTMNYERPCIQSTCASSNCIHRSDFFINCIQWSLIYCR